MLLLLQKVTTSCKYITNIWLNLIFEDIEGLEISNLCLGLWDFGWLPSNFFVVARYAASPIVVRYHAKRCPFPLTPSNFLFWPRSFYKWLKPEGKVLTNDYWRTVASPSAYFSEYVWQRVIICMMRTLMDRCAPQ